MITTIDQHKLKLAWVIVIICFVMFGVSIYSQTAKQQQFKDKVKIKVEQQTKVAAGKIGQKLFAIQQQLLNFKNEVELLDSKVESLDFLSRYFTEHPDLFSLNITYTPYLYDDKTKYVSPYYERFSGQTEIFQLSEYDNNKPEFSWYHGPLTKGPIWTEPYYEPHNNVLMTTYSTPFLTKEDKANGKTVSGVIPTDVSLEYLTLGLQELNLGLGGYGMIFSKEKNLIAHPVFSYVREGKEFSELLYDEEFSFLAKVEDCFLNDKQYRFYNGEVMNNDEDFAACIKIPHTDWTLITRMSADMFDVDNNNVRQGYIHAIGWLTLAIFLLIRIGSEHRQSLASASANINISALLLLSTIAVLALAKHFSVSNSHYGSSISNLAQREAFINNYQHQSEKLHNKTPVFVPTGIFIQSIEFVSAYNVHITGDVWQRFSEQEVPLSDLGIDFPNAIKKQLTETYRNKNEHGELVVGYQFDITLRQDFTYSKYPFDSKVIELQTKHTRLGDNVMLVPDLESFEKLGNKNHSSISDSVVLEEWYLNQSFYNYLYQHSKTSFGIENHRALKEPILTYTVILDRAFVGPFVTALLPILVMICLLYACIVSMPHTDYSELRNNITAIIFTILLAHYSIREHLQIDEVIYLELLYFLLYFIASVFMFLSHKFYVTQDLPKLNRRYKKLSIGGYWPILTSCILVLTVFTYY